MVVAGWALAQFVDERTELVDARTQGSDAVQAFSALRILSLRAQNDDNLVLIARGGGERYLDDYVETLRRIQGPDGTGGLMEVAEDVATVRGERSRMQPIRARFAAFTDSHRVVRANDEEGHYEDAVLVSTGVQRDASIALDDALRVEVTRAADGPRRPCRGRA